MSDNTTIKQNICSVNDKRRWCRSEEKRSNCMDAGTAVKRAEKEFQKGASGAET